ncbi:hypothetical protein WME90_27980 [Sorangium sp. So ce375]|uniref:hypothetical protein n=1 Tax=Sorangium sp. So ce375 TaxID=3133306 RepID=UPI003F5B12EE
MVLCCARRVAVFALPLLTAACIGAELDEQAEELGGEEELVGEADSEITSVNGALLNSLGANSLRLNSLRLNGLPMGALQPNYLDPNARSAIKDPGPNGTLAREVVRYVVSCALRPDQSFSFSWTDSGGVVHPEVYHGELGIAHWWAYGPISNDQFPQRHVTACLAARTNWYGTSVMVSLRNTEPSMDSTASEISTYSVREGAFWGNIFASTPYVRACYSPAGVTRARQALRECAAGHVSVDPATGATTTQGCGPIVILGSCDTLCNGVDAVKGFYRGCLEDPSIWPFVRTDQVVTSFLTP